MPTREKHNKQTQTHRISAAKKWLDERPVRLCIFLALFLNLVLECLSQRSVLQALAHAVTQPYLFALSALLIFATLCLSLLIPKRFFVLSLVSLVWLGLGIGNFVLLSYRVTPLSAIDFALLPSVFSIIGIYLKPWQIVLLCVAIAAALALLVLLVLRTPKRAILRLEGGLSLGISAALSLVLILLGLYEGVLPEQLSNLGEAYRDYGFAYCFCTSAVDRGIDRPKIYEEQMDDLVMQLENNPSKQHVVLLPRLPEDITPETTPQTQHPGEEEQQNLPETLLQGPNVVFLQLESFFDPAQLEQYTFSENPCPTFTKLKTGYPSGYLTVPSIGAGTANTEFEVITGMSLQFFGTGEYPYKTVLRDNTCETVCYNLAERGYTSTAIHNNKATFYDRDEVFSNLGFERFIALEYMNGVRYNPQGWACDDVLTELILDTLTTTEQSDLIYTISVQAHGRYPDERLEEDTGEIVAEGAEDAVMENRITYYVNQLAEMDAFLAELTQALQAFEEHTVLVLYGDHLPAMELTDEDVTSGNLFQTEYVIWSNFELQAEDRDLCAYQLSARVMELLGYENGNLTKLHQQQAEEADYLQMLELLEYDMLYGEQFIFDGENPYLPTQLQLGLHPIMIETVGTHEGDLYVSGENFTPYSVVCINGRQEQTQWISEWLLRVEDVDFTRVRSVSVEQVSENHEILSETAQYVIP